MPRKPPPLTRHAVTAPTEDQGTRLTGGRMLPLDLLTPNPWQPRQHADPERMRELVDDVAARGILEPIIVRPTLDGRYEVVAGERRYRAAVAAGLATVPVIIRPDMSEEEAREASLVENLLREDLDVEDEARFIKALYEQKRSLRAVGDAIHKSYQYVNRRLKLLENPQAMLAYRQGLINLDNLISGEDLGLDDVPMSDASAVAEHNREEEPGAVTDRNNIEEVRFFRTRSAFKPFQKLQLHVRRLETTEIGPEDRPRLRQAVQELIAELTRLEQTLQEPTEVSQPSPVGADDIELKEIPGPRPAYSVHRKNP